MENFFIHSTILVKVVYVVSLLIVLSYVFIKYIKKKYILSFFNIGLYILLISHYIISLYQYNAIPRLIDDEYTYYYFLNKSIIINLMGMGLLFIFLLLFEFNKKNIKINKMERIFKNNINVEVIKLINKIVIILWLVLVFSKLGFSLPLFGNRGFLVNSSLQSAYNILNSILEYSLLVYIFYSKKNILIYINIFLLISTGNRGPVLSILLLFYIYYFYKNNIQFLKKIILSFFIFIFLLVCLFILEQIRGTNQSTILKKIFYGNTFSDIRDGAFILYGMEKLKITFLYGKMYLADLLSFIPSEFLKYREIYGYSNFTTKTLFKWQEHYGLRGGLFITPYINFGFLGIIFSSMLAAFNYSILERYFYNRQINGNNILYLKLIFMFTGTFLCTTYVMFFYIFLAYLFLIISASNLLKPYFKRKGK